MKKLISLVLSVIMAVSAMACFAVPAMAASVNSPAATTAVSKRPVLQVNGSINTTDISYTADATNPNKITFTYSGEGEITGWETNLDDLGLVEGTDYNITYNEDKTLTIEFVSEEAISAWDNGEVTVNALVEFEEEDTTEATTTSGTATTKATTTAPNSSNKAPNTGASTSAIAATIAVAGAGFAVLVATKKKDAE